MSAEDDKMDIEVRKSLQQFLSSSINFANQMPEEEIRRITKVSGWDTDKVPLNSLRLGVVRGIKKHHEQIVSNEWVIVVDKDAMDSYADVTNDDKELNAETIPFDHFYLVRYDRESNRVDSTTLYTTGSLTMEASDLMGGPLFAQTFRRTDTINPKYVANWNAKPSTEVTHTMDYSPVDVNHEGNMSERLWYRGYHEMCNNKHFKKSIRDGLPSKLAKKRIRKDKSEFVGRFTVIKPVVSDYEAQEPQGGTKAAHWVRGHFKKCKTGTFWWKAHIAGSGELKAKPYKI